MMGFSAVLREPLAEQALAQIENDLGVPTGAFAAEISPSSDSLEEWLSVLQRLNALLLLDIKLRERFTSLEAARAWLATPNRYLGGEKPVDLARSGQLHRLEAALEALDSGVFV
jgi:Protein of unknown function (DUF2384)